jgi:hippurate hydrolase
MSNGVECASWRWFSCLACSLLWIQFSGSGRAAEPTAWFDDHADAFVALYQHFHTHPELSNHEVETAARLAEELTASGCEVTTGVGKHGVVGVLKNGEGPVVMWRSDLDALPVTENTGLAYASTVRTQDDAGADVGVMHACGHDIHITNLISTARYMAAHRDAWRGTIVFIGQPAEERLLGAQQMLDDGLFTRFPKPDFCLALHVDATLSAGLVGCRGGYSMANVDSCDIIVRGRGGHGSFPQGCIDPIVQAAELIVALQTIVSREISPLEPAVVTVGSIHGGTKHNIIPDTCKLQLTIRSYAPEVRAKLQEAIIRKANGIAAAAGAPAPEIKYSEGVVALFNDEVLAERITPVLMGELGADRVVESDRTMGGEDFALFGVAGVPVFMFRLGAVPPDRMEEFAARGLTPPSLHSAEFYPEPRETLRTGLKCSVAALRELLARPR